MVHDGCDFYVWHYILGFKLSAPYQVALADLAPPPGLTAPNPYEGENYIFRSFHSAPCVNGSIVQLNAGSGGGSSGGVGSSSGGVGSSIGSGGSVGGGDAQCVQLWTTMAGSKGGAGPLLGKHQTVNSTATNGTDFFELSVLTPVLSNGFALLGETAKYVSASPDRFKFITVNPTAIILTVVGAAGETVQITALVPVTAPAPAPVPADEAPRALTMKVVVVDVVIPRSGLVLVTVSQ